MFDDTIGSIVLTSEIPRAKIALERLVLISTQGLCSGLPSGPSLVQNPVAPVLWKVWVYQGFWFLHPANRSLGSFRIHASTVIEAMGEIRISSQQGCYFV